MGSPLYHCHAVAVAQRAVTVATDRMKCCWRRWAYGWIAALVWLRDFVEIFLHNSEVCELRVVAREKHLALSIVYSSEY